MSEAVALRPSQQAVVAYRGGKMAVAAVPGSGKTFTLSHLAAALVEHLADTGRLDEQEVLIVTFTNPAVNSFRRRIAELVRQERGLLPYVGYRVRTLHGLAHDIVRMRPALVGLSETFEILDERITASIIRDLAERWVRAHGDNLLPYMEPGLAEDVDQLRYQIRQYGPELIENIAAEVIRLGKDYRWDPDDMRARLEALPFDLPLARIGLELYEEYQRALSYRGGVDFDDLVRLAMQALETDAEFLERLRQRWPYILEDEAQDSSKLQNDMLRLLSGDRNWVRVGDPNQAIYTTFTTADSNLLRAFMNEPDVAKYPLPVSGRSAPSIIALANYLVRWSNTNPLIQHLWGALDATQEIVPTDPDDRQPNPPDGLIYLDYDPQKPITPEEEIHRIATSLERWLPDHPDWTVAVLAPENSRGFKMAEELKERGIPYEELLRSTSATRDAAERLQIVLDFLAEPSDNRRLARLYSEVWWPLCGLDDDEETRYLRDQVLRMLRQLKTTEDFLWPGPQSSSLAYEDEAISPLAKAHLEAFRERAQIWLNASILPIDQLVLTLSQDLFSTQADLALGHKIAVVLGSIAANNPDYRLSHFSQELRVIAQNERRFLGFDDATEGYEPKPGIVTVATMHAAKGLEWDRVYLMAVNNYSFPAALPGDQYVAEKWFIRDSLNLQAEARQQVELLMAGRAAEYVEGKATQQARLEYAAERLRLLYVGITRARRDLIITWNMGRYWDQGRRNGPAIALIALTDFWREGLRP